MNEAYPVGQVLSMVRRLTDGRHVGILNTVDADGRPHGAYMGSVALDGGTRLLTITSPHSRKVANIQQRPQVEWMFSDESMDHVVYLRGRARLVEEDVEILRSWKVLPDKSRAYFLSFQESGIGFRVIATEIEEVEFCVPSRNVSQKHGASILLEGGGGA